MIGFVLAYAFSLVFHVLEQRGTLSQPLLFRDCGHVSDNPCWRAICIQRADLGGYERCDDGYVRYGQQLFTTALGAIGSYYLYFYCFFSVLGLMLISCWLQETSIAKSCLSFCS
jgi:hypothetical protein